MACRGSSSSEVEGNETLTMPRIEGDGRSLSIGCWHAADCLEGASQDRINGYLFKRWAAVKMLSRNLSVLTVSVGEVEEEEVSPNGSSGD